MRVPLHRTIPWLPRVVLHVTLAGSLVALCPQHARAQTAEEKAAARDLATRGAQAFQAGEWQKAYEFFDRAESLFHAPPHLLYMARCSEKLGRLVEATELYNRILREQLSTNAPAAFKQAQESAAEEIEGVAPRLARVTVTLEGPGADQVEVLANGNVVPRATLGVPRPIDPGDYEFTVQAERVQAEPVSITLAEGAEEAVVLRLSEIEGQPSALAPSVSAQPLDSEATSSPVPAYVALGVGAVGLGLGTVFLLDHFNKQGRADDLFTEGGCDRDDACTSGQQDEIKSLSSRAATSGTLSIVGFGVGAAGVGAGLFLLLTSKDGPEQAAKRQETERHVRPLIGWQSVGLAGRF